MNEYVVMNILDLIDTVGEEELCDILSDFSCPQNEEIEFFLLNNAIEFAKRKMSITHLVFNNAAQFIAYFTLTHKPSCINEDLLSNTSKKKLQMHARLDESGKSYNVSAYLIAQFGKNYSHNIKTRISGNDLMNTVFNVLKQVQRQIGGGVVFLECQDNKTLLDFYQNEHNRFRIFGDRYSQREQIRYLKLLRFF